MSVGQLEPADQGEQLHLSLSKLVCMECRCFVILVVRYDEELYQRIEQLIGKRLRLHHTIEEEVMSLMERVTEAQRYARMVSGWGY